MVCTLYLQCIDCTAEIYDCVGSMLVSTILYAQQICYVMSPLFFTELTIGFEMERYTFMEPEAGVSVRIATVCIVLADGSSQLGVPLTVQPLWRDGLAIGTIIHLQCA